MGHSSDQGCERDSGWNTCPGKLTLLMGNYVEFHTLQRGLHHHCQLLQETTLPGVFHATGLSPGNQPVVHGARLTHSGLPGLGVTRHVIHQLSLPARELHRSPYRPDDTAASRLVSTNQGRDQ